MQASQAIDPEVHSSTERSLQSPDPPTFPDLAHSRLMAVYLVNDHHSQFCLRVCVIVKVSRHGGIFSPHMRDVEMMTIDPAMEVLSCFAYIRLATPPVCD